MKIKDRLLIIYRFTDSLVREVDEKELRLYGDRRNYNNIKQELILLFHLSNKQRRIKIIKQHQQNVNIILQILSPYNVAL